MPDLTLLDRILRALTPLVAVWWRVRRGIKNLFRPRASLPK